LRRTEQKAANPSPPQSSVFPEAQLSLCLQAESKTSYSPVKSMGTISSPTPVLVHQDVKPFFLAAVLLVVVGEDYARDQKAQI